MHRAKAKKADLTEKGDSRTKVQESKESRKKYAAMKKLQLQK